MVTIRKLMWVEVEEKVYQHQCGDCDIAFSDTYTDTQLCTGCASYKGAMNLKMSTNQELSALTGTEKCYLCPAQMPQWKIYCDDCFLRAIFILFQGAYDRKQYSEMPRYIEGLANNLGISEAEAIARFHLDDHTNELRFTGSELVPR